MAVVQIRPADPVDIPRVIGLPQPGEAGGDPRMAAYLAGDHHPREALAPRAMWIAWNGDHPVGYVAGHLTRRFRCDGELQWIHVAAAYRRRGIASRLIRTLASWFVEHGARRVCVDVGDQAARAFYARLGAVELNRHWMVWDDIGRVLDAGSGSVG